MVQELYKVPVVYSVKFDELMDKFSQLNSTYKYAVMNTDNIRRWLLCSHIEASVYTIADDLMNIIDYNTENNKDIKNKIITREQQDFINRMKIRYKESLYDPVKHSESSEKDMSTSFNKCAGEIVRLFDITMQVKTNIDKMGGLRAEEYGTPFKRRVKRVLHRLSGTPLKMPKKRLVYYINYDPEHPGAIPEISAIENYQNK